MSSPFRERSLQSLSSPDQIDRLMRVTNSRNWLLLLALTSLIAVVVVWSIVGRIATTVEGQGILIKTGGVLDVVAVDSGQVSALYVDVGSTVQRGQIVARIAQPELEQQLENAQNELEELRRQDQMIRELGATSSELRESFAGQQRATLMSSIRSSRQRLAWLEQHAKKQMQLAEKGLVTEQAIEATRLQIETTRQKIKDDLDRAKSLAVSSQEVRGRKEREELQSELRIREAERRIALLEQRMEQASRVVSPHSGRVLEVRLSVGSLASPGQPILNLEPEGSRGSGLQALIYVPLDKGKSVHPGMRVRVSPANVRKEVHGVMHGIVTGVAEFPSTRDGMQRVLRNELLVQRFLSAAGSAPIEVVAELVPSGHTDSGYRWSSGEGPSTQLGPGTPATAVITVEQVRPIEKVIPLLRETLGV